MDFYQECNTICMKARRICIAIAITIALSITLTAVAFFLLTTPAVKIGGWKELDMHTLESVRHAVTVLDSDGNTIVENYYSNNRMFTPIDEIPKDTQNAFVSIEDKRFYSHRGIDYVRMLGALKNNIFSASLKEGASTITQQLIKNTHLSGEKTFSRKFQEIRMAKQLEKTYSKDRILETYLNVVYFGNNIYGIGQAAKTYFNKSVPQLTVGESALLAGIINNPARFNPVTHPEQAKTRRNIVLQSMVTNGKLDADTAEKCKAEDVQINEIKQNVAFVTYLESIVSEAAIAMDRLPEELFERNCTIIAKAKKNEYTNVFNSMSHIAQENGVNWRVLVVDNCTACVIYDDSNMKNAHALLRQPGSAVKPFIAYAPALEKKAVYPVSVIQDEKTDFNGYAPKNFNDKYYGDITVADSLKYSLNIPAVKLTDMCGLPYAKAVASRFGIPFDAHDAGLAVALGGMHTGVTLKCLADAYATLANGGVYRPAQYVQAVYENDACVYSCPQAEGKRAVGEDTAFLLTDMLRQCAQSGTAKKLQAHKNVAAKTGTVERGESNSDAYCIAYTPKYTVAVWYGCDSGDVKIYGGQQPAKTVAAVLRALGDDTSFVPPDSVELYDIDCKKLYEEKAVYLAAPSLAKRYRTAAYFSKNNLPKRYSYGELPFIFDDPLLDGENFEIFERLA